MYSDYEDCDKGKYKVTIGYAVPNTTNIPDGLSSVIIPSGKYKNFLAKSRAPEDIVIAWQTVWMADAKELPRNFIADFELYMEIH